MSAGAETVRAYIQAHNTRVVYVDQMGPRVLRGLWLAGLRLQGAECLLGGPVSHDELVNAIAEMEFPDISRARQVYFEWVLSKMPAIGQE